MKKISPFLFVFCSSLNAFAQSINSAHIHVDLNRAMDLGENYSFSVKTADSEATNAQRQKNFSVTQMGPSLSASGTQNWYDKSNTFSNVNNHGEGAKSSTWSVTATQPLVALIPNAMKIGQTSSTLQSTKSNLMAERINARLEGAKAYILVQQALRTLEAKKAALKSAEEIYKEAQILFDTGSVEKTKIDVLQTKAEAAAARLAEISAQKDLQAALIDLGTKIGVQNTELIHISLEETSVWEKTNPFTPNLEVALKQALKQRPEINAVEEKFSATKLNVAQSYFNYLPQVNFFATYSKATNDTEASLPNSTVNESLYGLSLNWSIWDGGVQAAAISANVNEKTKASLDKEKIITTVTQDVFNSLNDLNTAIKSLKDAKEAAQSYEESYKLATIQYKTGDYSAINLIETQNKMTAAQVALANVRGGLDLSWMKLQAALGESPHI
ncbi:MAG: TolC family protein [Bdellovibrionota bacterium]